MAFLEICNITKSFGDFSVLKGIEFTAEKGEVVCLVGASGGGKTTMLRCLNLLETPDSGRITVDGQVIFDGENTTPLSAEEIHNRRLMLGLVFQQFNLFPQYSVLENLCLAPKLMADKAEYPRIEQEAMELLTRLGLADKKDSYPCELSGGQQQRVAIARALMLKPRVLCFDEPTSALDPALTHEVLQVIRDLAATGMTQVIVTHDMDFARKVCDKAVFIASGRVVEMGTPAQIFDNPQHELTRAFLAQDEQE
ncbi:MAG: amino acid ABC transporter ATP-binding protein [Clostridia bacterium]|nr:amino acid ABC transporter ATP-binding protein [Clostridia bacterium]